MKLIDWLAANGVSQYAFAPKIEVTRGYLCKICAGTQWPSRDIWRRIYVETEGAVTPTDHLDLDKMDAAA